MSDISILMNQSDITDATFAALPYEIILLKHLNDVFKNPHVVEAQEKTNPIFHWAKKEKAKDLEKKGYNIFIFTNWNGNQCFFMDINRQMVFMWNLQSDQPSAEEEKADAMQEQGDEEENDEEERNDEQGKNEKAKKGKKNH